MPNPREPLVVALLGTPEVSAATLYGFFDVLAGACRDWQVVHGALDDAPPSPFHPCVITRDGLPFTAANGVRITPDFGFAECPPPAIVCITDLMLPPGVELGDRLARIHDLDGGHPHLARRLEVDAEVVQQDRVACLDAQPLERELVEAPLRLPASHDRRLDDDVEVIQHLGEAAAARPRLASAHDVVGHQRRREVLVAARDGLDHRRAQLAGEAADHLAAVDHVTQRRGFGLERLDEPVEGQLAALEARPRVRVGVGRVDRADQPLGQPGTALVRRERVEGRREDDPTEVEQHRSHGRAS